EHRGHDQPDPAVGLETVPEQRTLEALRDRPVIAKGPDRVEDPHDTGRAQHDGREHYPTLTTPIHCCPSSEGRLCAPVGALPILVKPPGGVVTLPRVIPRSQSSPRSTARSMASERDATPSFW